ncbi:I78 family peptidase inhibitor [Achromobacter sp. F4_2707]|uniref:I78 family peptidase inhibitor n=1 Tax=Achromobacter sp. F4_2707 TaxID=3114286 RepID=UPI0039C67C2E
MRYLLSIPLVLLVAACQSPMPFEAESDRCGSLNYLSMVGLQADAIQNSSFPAGTRIIRPGMAVTQDHRADRLNVHINEKGRIERINCG